jgi:hypothetical protein
MEIAGDTIHSVDSFRRAYLHGQFHACVAISRPTTLVATRGAVWAIGLATRRR